MRHLHIHFFLTAILALAWFSGRAQELPLVMGHSSGQMATWVKDQPQSYYYCYNRYDMLLLKQALEPVRKASPQGVLIWGMNLGRDTQFLPQALAKVMGNEWQTNQVPVVFGCLYVPRIALAPVKFAPCNDALDFTVFGGCAVGIRTAVIEKPESEPAKIAATLTAALKPDERDRLLLVIVSRAVGACGLVSVADALRQALPSRLTIIGIVGGTPLYQLKTYGNGLVAAMIAGMVQITATNIHSYQPLTPPMRIGTSSSGKIAMLDEKPIKGVYAGAIGSSYEGLKRETLLRRFPLGIRRGEVWEPVQTLAMDAEGNLATAPVLSPGDQVVIMKQDEARFAALVAEYAKSNPAQSANRPGWELVIDNNLAWQGWTAGEADYNLLTKAAGTNTVVNLIYPGDSFMIGPDGHFHRGLFNLLSVKLEQMLEK